MRPSFDVRPFDAGRDTDELVRMWRSSFEHGVGVRDPHPLPEQVDYLLDQVVPTHRILVAHRSGIVGFVAATPDSIGQLYVRVDALRQGVGSCLLRNAQRESRGHLWLHTFARNTGARAFYAHHGFIEVEHGFEPTWQLADVRMVWTRPGTPVTP